MSGKGIEATPEGVPVNDVHSQLNETRVHRIARPDTIAAVQVTILEARQAGRAVSVAGGRHAMGGQQFGAGAVLIDTQRLDRVLSLDLERGEIEVEAGILWPMLIEGLIEAQRGRSQQWGIRQKQTGADRLSIGGSLAANVHGRGLRMPPIVADVESFLLVDASGELRRCSRHENAELFSLVIGGYGLFGVLVSARLRLAPRTKVERIVERIDVTDLMGALERRIGAGFTYGDFQFSIDSAGADFLRGGILSCYRPVEASTPIRAEQLELASEDWRRLIWLCHVDKRAAVDFYSDYYLSTSGQIYWSDTHQLSEYFDDYHRELDARLGTPRATEMITELYVPRSRLAEFLSLAAAYFRSNEVDLIYGTVRLIERDDESFLAWAREAYACVVFNLHVVHGPEGAERGRRAFRHLIDLALGLDGSYFLTYHRYATRRQVETAYPRFVDFLRRKRRSDAEELFQSEWYRHYRAMFADVLGAS